MRRGRRGAPSRYLSLHPCTKIVAKDKIKEKKEIFSNLLATILSSIVFHKGEGKDERRNSRGKEMGGSDLPSIQTSPPAIKVSQSKG